MAKFFPESSFPYIDISMLIIKNDSVSGQPDDPGGCDENFSEDDTPKSFSSFYHHV